MRPVRATSTAADSALIRRSSEVSGEWRWGILCGRLLVSGLRAWQSCRVLIQMHRIRSLGLGMQGRGNRLWLTEGDIGESLWVLRSHPTCSKQLRDVAGTELKKGSSQWRL